MGKGGDFIVGAIFGGLVGGLVVFIGYEKINSALGGTSLSRFARRRGYFTNHLDIYPYRPPNLLE